MSLPFRQKLAAFILLLVVGVVPAQSGTINPGTFYVVGTGPAGPEHATQRALEVIKKADFILCDENMKKRFSAELQNKPILADPWQGMWFYQGKPWGELNPQEKRAYLKKLIDIRENIIRQVRDALAQGKTVALLDSGDPCLFGPSHWFIEGFDPEQVEIIPGVGAFSAAMAALKKSSLPAHEAQFVIQTSPSFLTDNKEKAERIAKSLANHPSTLVFYMGIKELNTLVPMLRASYPDDFPIAVVFNAGYPDKEKIIKGTLITIIDKLAGAPRSWLSLIIMGRCLEGKPLRSAVERLNYADN